MLDIDMEIRNGILFVRFDGVINKNTFSKLNNLISMIKYYGIRYLVYNFSNLLSIDKNGYKSLLNGYDAVVNNSGKVYVVENQFNLDYFVSVKNELAALKLLNI